MNLTITNQTCEDIIFNGNYLEKLYFGNDLVWEKQHGPTHDYSQDYFTIESLEDGNTITVNLDRVSNAPTDDQLFVHDLYYSTNNGATWTNIPIVDGVVNIALNYKEKALFKALGYYWHSQVAGIEGIYFGSTKTFDVNGNLMSLIYGDAFTDTENYRTTSTGNFAFLGLFKNSKVVNAENLILPDCNPGSGCCRGMFNECTQLKIGPQLMPLTLKSMYYYGMFYGCTSLVTAPELPATILAAHCYYNMFNGCTSLNKVTCLATDISATGCLTDWLVNASSTGTFVKNPSMSSWPRSVSGIPTGWTVVNAS